LEALSQDAHKFDVLDFLNLLSEKPMLVETKHYRKVQSILSGNGRQSVDGCEAAGGLERRLWGD
jgi:hypothetical protein